MEQDKMETLCKRLDEINNYNRVELIRKAIDDVVSYRDNILGTDKEDIGDLQSRADNLVNIVNYEMFKSNLNNDLKELFHI